MTKPIQYCDLRTRRATRKSEVTKNELMRQMIAVCLQNELKFRFVLTDSWFSSEENFEFVTARGKHFISALKDNRLLALSAEDKKHKRFTRVDELQIPEYGVVRGYLKGYAKEVLVVRQVFKNKDASTGTLHLVCLLANHMHDLQLELRAEGSSLFLGHFPRPGGFHLSRCPGKLDQHSIFMVKSGSSAYPASDSSYQNRSIQAAPGGTFSAARAVRRRMVRAQRWSIRATIWSMTGWLLPWA